MNQPFLNRLKSTKGLIWDLDNTLYRLNEALFKAFHIAVARAVIEAGVEMDLDHAIDMARRSFEEYGFSGRVFVNDYGVDNAWLHDKYHRYLDEALIDINAQMVELFAAMPQVEHALITHGSGEWALRVLTHLGLAEWFRLERILAFEDYNFKRKSDDPESFNRALERMELDARDVIMLEDTGSNLAIPHAMGMGTVLIHHGREPDIVPPYVDILYDNALDFMRDLHGAQNLAA